MLYGLGEQIAHCYQRAAECGELAVRDDVNRDFYLDRQKAWLKLARSFEFSERINQVLNERQKQRLRNRPVTVSALKVPNCPACDVEMFVQNWAMTTEPVLFLCPNCQLVCRTGG
jgi:hypothetical protein